METSKFTFAELDFICQDDERWPAARESLSLVFEPSETVRAAGAASLLARDLAEVQGEDIKVSPQATTPAEALLGGGLQIALALGDAEGLSVSSVQFASQQGPRLLISPAAPGVYDLRVLNSRIPAVELLTTLAIQVTTPGSTLGIAHGDTVLQLVHARDGSWASRIDQDVDPEVADEADIRAQVAAVFGPVLAGQER